MTGLLPIVLALAYVCHRCLIVVIVIIFVAVGDPDRKPTVSIVVFIVANGDLVIVCLPVDGAIERVKDRDLKALAVSAAVLVEIPDGGLGIFAGPEDAIFVGDVAVDLVVEGYLGYGFEAVFGDVQALVVVVFGVQTVEDRFGGDRTSALFLRTAKAVARGTWAERRAVEAFILNNGLEWLQNGVCELCVGSSVLLNNSSPGCDRNPVSFCVLQVHVQLGTMEVAG